MLCGRSVQPKTAFRKVRFQQDLFCVIKKLFVDVKSCFLTGLLEQAYEQLKEAAYLFGRVCDSLHPEACHCLSLLAKMAYVQGHPAEVHIRATCCPA